MRSFRTFSLLLALLAAPFAARGQCAGGLIVNCPAAVTPQSTDVLQLWQLGQTPHMRSLQLGLVGVGQFLPTTGGAITGPLTMNPLLLGYTGSAAPTGFFANPYLFGTSTASGFAPVNGFSTVDVANFANGQLGIFSVIDNFGSSAMKGSRAAGYFSAYDGQGTTGSTSDTQRQWIALQSIGSLSHNEGGTGLTAGTTGGWIIGGHDEAALYSGATDISGAEGREIDLHAEAGSSVGRKCGLCIFEDSLDAVQGSLDDGAIIFAAGLTGEVGVKCIFCFGSATANWPNSTNMFSDIVGLDGTGAMTPTTIFNFPDVVPTGYEINMHGFTVDGSGNLVAASAKAKTTGTATNCSSSASPAVCGSAAAGSVAVPTGSDPTLVVDTSVVTANSQILLTVDESLGTKLGVTCNSTIATLGPAVVTARSAGVGFTIEIGATVATNPACLSYRVVN